MLSGRGSYKRAHILALAGVAQWTECRRANQKVADLILN